jgi:hypothetical protein
VKYRVLYFLSYRGPGRSQAQLAAEAEAGMDDDEDEAAGPLSEEQQRDLAAIRARKKVRAPPRPPTRCCPAAARARPASHMRHANATLPSIRTSHHHA